MTLKNVYNVKKIIKEQLVNQNIVLKIAYQDVNNREYAFNAP